MQARPSSGESDQDIDSAAREDLVKLQRKFRLTEGSRKQYAEHAANSLRKQQAMIEALQAENVDLKKNLSLASSRQNEVRDKLIADRFEDLLSNQIQYKDSITEEEMAIHELEKKIRDMELVLAQRRKDVGGAMMSQTQGLYLHKQMRVKENRLDKAAIRFNTSLASNAQLRFKIDHLRKDRSVFEGQYKRLQRELIELKGTMGQVIEVSTQAYESRDDAQNKMLALKEKADKEQTQFNVELKELIRVIDHDRKLREFMSCKDKERTEAHEQMELMRKKKEAEKSSERENTVMSYEQAFEQIKEATGITDIDKLVTKFIEVEDKNFALFNYVNELNGEMELLQEQIQQIHTNIEQFKSQGVEMEAKRKDILDGLEAELSEIQDKTRSHDARYVAATKVLDQLKSGVESVFSKIGCDVTAITDMLGGHAGVTDNTVLQYLGIVEQRTNELLQLQAFIHAKESEDREAMSRFLMGLGPGQALLATSFPLPSTAGDDVDSEEEESEGKPLSTEELRAKASRGLLKLDHKKDISKKHSTVSGTGGPPATVAMGKMRPPATNERKKNSFTR